VLLGFVTAWRFADWPTSTSPSLLKATIDGVVRSPSLFSITLGFPPSMTATQELVVPRSIPITLPIMSYLQKFRKTVENHSKPSPDVGFGVLISSARPRSRLSLPCPEPPPQRPSPDAGAGRSTYSPSGTRSGRCPAPLPRTVAPSLPRAASDRTARPAGPLRRCRSAPSSR